MPRAKKKTRKKSSPIMNALKKPVKLPFKFKKWG